MAKARAPRNRDSTSRETQNLERRDSIIRALHRCIAKRGFSKTSLTNIAVEAGMSPSHIRYYFEGKDAILESYLEQTCTQILERIRAIDTDDAERWFEEFTTFFIGNPWITPGRLSVQMEIFGVSIHDKALRHIKVNYDQQIRLILEGYFERVGTAPGLTPKSAAEIAQALEAGLKYNTVFQDQFDPVHTRKIFIAGINHLTGDSSSDK
jgi:AcrR family transcriptional regulator